MNFQKAYIAIDLKSFYASVECSVRNLDALSTNLIVADSSRTEKTICLAVTPSLKAYGIPGRVRLFDVVRKIKEINADRLRSAIRQGKVSRGPDGAYHFSGVSADARELAADPSLELGYIVAPPRMKLYENISTKIFSIYMKYISDEDIHVYSIDECFMDVIGYLETYAMNARELAMTMIRDVLYNTGITATAGIGTNMYLAKIAMDIVAKHIPADADGVRIAQLDERSYREQLWAHRPLTDFWRVGRGISRRLEKVGLYTMGDIARCSVGSPGSYYNEDLLYRLFGVNAELLIDHAWGYEPAEIADCKSYVPESKSLSSSQILPVPYPAEKGRLVVCEMADLMSLDLVRKGLVTDQLVLDVAYDTENVKDPARAAVCTREIVRDYYGRPAPKPAHGSVNLDGYTASTRKILSAVAELYDRIVSPDLLVRRFAIAAMHLLPEQEAKKAAAPPPEQLDLFTDYAAREREEAKRREEEDRERRLQHTLIELRDRFGKNAVIRGMNLQEGATAMERNRLIGGHRAEQAAAPELRRGKKTDPSADGNGAASDRGPAPDRRSPK